MKVKLRDLWNAQQTIDKLADSTDIHPVARFRMARLYKRVSELGDELQKIVNKHQSKDSQQSQDPAKMNAEIDELLDAEEKIDFEPFDVTMLSLDELAGKDVVRLEPFLDITPLIEQVESDGKDSEATSEDEA